MVAATLRLGRDLFASLPGNANAMIISVNAPPAPFVPEWFHFMPGYVVVVVGFGSAQHHDGVLDPIRAALPPLFEFVTPMPYTELPQIFDEGARWGLNYYEKARSGRSGRRCARTRPVPAATSMP
ncbi:MAG: hypothetical protein WA731_12600 [Pseudonocardiaceae bacterium]|nr:hypothetical protein [Pseudonocardiaceae bacterium]